MINLVAVPTLITVGDGPRKYKYAFKITVDTKAQIGFSVVLESNTFETEEERNRYLELGSVQQAALTIAEDLLIADAKMFLKKVGYRD